MGIGNIALLNNQIPQKCCGFISFLYHKPMETNYYTLLLFFMPFIWETQYMQNTKKASKSLWVVIFVVKSIQYIDERCQAASFFMAHHQYIIHQGGDHYSFSFRP